MPPSALDERRTIDTRPRHRDDEVRRHEDTVPLGVARNHAAGRDRQQQERGDGRAQIVNYIRGDRANEKPLGANYRKRSGVLGDIIHSRPIFVDHATDPRVYVGANDGMLHAFDADTGDEVFAYVPSFFISPVAATSFSHVKALTVDPYVHNYFVDASPNARKVTISGAAKTILVGGVGAGGKGLYALDITDPTAASEAAAASKILWEITPTTINNVASTAYADLGYTYGIPVIAKLNDGTWVAIVGNGYNNTGGNQAVLYVINLLTGAKIAGDRTTSPSAVLRHQSQRPVQPDGDRHRPRRQRRLRLRRRHQRQSVEVRHPEHRLAGRHQALHDEPGAADHRPARGVAASERRLHGQFRHRPDVHQRRRHGRHDGLLRVRHPGQRHDDRPTPTSSARR